MKVTLLTAAIALVGTKALAADTLTRDEIAKLPFMTAFAYAEAIDAFCLAGMALCQHRSRSCGNHAGGPPGQIICRGRADG